MTSLYSLTDKFGEFFGEPKIERLQPIDTPVYGFSKAFLEQVERDLAMYEKQEDKE